MDNIISTAVEALQYDLPHGMQHLRTLLDSACENFKALSDVKCDKPCDSCCCHTTRVSTFPLEALDIAKNCQLDKKYLIGYTGTKCPLLKDGKCSIYEYRPLICRAYFTAPDKHCQISYGGPVELAVTMSRLTPDYQNLRLHKALPIAMQSRALQRFLKGDKSLWTASIMQ